MMRHGNPVCKDRAPGAAAATGLGYSEIGGQKVMITALNLARRTVLFLCGHLCLLVRSFPRKVIRPLPYACVVPTSENLGGSRFAT